MVTSVDHCCCQHKQHACFTLEVVTQSVYSSRRSSSALLQPSLLRVAICKLIYLLLYSWCRWSMKAWSMRSRSWRKRQSSSTVSYRTRCVWRTSQMASWRRRWNLWRVSVSRKNTSAGSWSSTSACVMWPTPAVPTWHSPLHHPVEMPLQLLCSPQMQKSRQGGYCIHMKPIWKENVHPFSYKYIYNLIIASEHLFWRFSRKVGSSGWLDM